MTTVATRALNTSVTEAAILAAGCDPKEKIEMLATRPDDALGVYIEASKLKDDFDSKLKELSRLMTAIEPTMIEYFKEKGIQRVTRSGRTVYLARELWPKVIDDDLTKGVTDDQALAKASEEARARLIEALEKDPETHHLVKASYNHQTLRSFILNDCPEGEDGMPTIPEHLKGKLGISEVFKAKVLKS